MSIRKLLLVVACMHTAFTFGQVEFTFSSIDSLNSEINSAYEETNPIFDASTNTLYFTRSLHPENVGGEISGQDIWATTKENGSWTTPTNDFEEFNNALNNAVIGVSSDGQQLFLHSTYANKMSLIKGYSETHKNEGAWAKPEELDIPGLNFKGEFYSGFVTSSAKYAILSMESKSSLGQEDLYISINTDGDWSKPIWMGEVLNTEGFEISPYLFDDGQTLIFASNGHGGYGDCDLFYSYRQDSTWTNWSKPVNMGELINSKGFDAFAHPVGDMMYFCSNRGGKFSNIYFSVNSSYYKTADTARISFEMNNSKLSDVVIDVYDESKALVSTQVADNTNVVNIPDLKEGFEYTLKPRHSSANVDVFTAYALNPKSQPIQLLTSKGDGIPYTARSFEYNQESKVISKPEVEIGMTGIYELNGVPVRNVLMELIDSEGNVQQYSTTSNSGKFAFAETPDEKEYFVNVVTDLEYLKQNGKIYYTDKKGNKLFIAQKDESGNYGYQKLQAQQLAQMKMMQEMESGDLDQSKGVFKFEDLPREGVKLLLVDENDNVIEEVVTDADGEFAFSKLAADKGFQIRVADENDAVLRADGNILFMDKDGNELNIMNAGAGDGSFVYQPLSADLSSRIAMIEEEDGSRLDNNFIFSVGLFKYQNLPSEGIKLRLLDENDNIIEIVETDAKGQFVFSMLKPGKDYKIQVVDFDEKALKQSELYFVSKEGEVVTGQHPEGESVYTFNELSPDYYFSMSQLNQNESELRITESFKDVSGQFKYQSLPKAGVKLYLLDENNKVIEEVYTDDNGNFKFSKLAKESNFYVKLAEDDMALLDHSSLIMMNEEDEPLEQEMADDGGFSFKTLPRASSGMAGLEEEDSSGLTSLIQMTSGIYKYERLPKEGMVLQLLDENDNIIETVVTDENGHFYFTKMKEGVNYKVSVKDLSQSDVQKSDLYFISRSGNVLTASNEDGTSQFTFNALEGDFFNALDEVGQADSKFDTQKAFADAYGSFDYNGLPKEGIQLSLLNEHDKVLESVATDDKGNFKLTQLPNNSSFRLVIEDDGIDASLAQIKLVDENKKPLNTAKNKDGEFTFMTPKIETESEVAMSGSDGSMLAGLTGTGKNDFALSTTSFHFNSVRLSDRDRYYLNQNVVYHVAKSNQPILIVGYSCDIGTKEEQRAVAQARADEIKAYLVSMEIDESRIETAVVVDGLDGIEYPTTDQRVENRKAVVYHLAP